MVERDPTLITDPKELRALTHPTRLAIIDLFAIEPTVTATRCAEVTGESVASCSYHLGMLAKYGYIGEAPGGQGRERPWQLLRKTRDWSSQGTDTEGALAAEALTDVYIDHAMSQMKTAMRRATREPEPWRHGSGLSGGTAYLTPDELAALNDELIEICKRYVDRTERPELRPDGARPVRLFLARWLATPPAEQGDRS